MATYLVTNRIAAEELENAFSEGWRKGYRAGLVDGQSDSDWCDEVEDYLSSKTRALVDRYSA